MRVVAQLENPYFTVTIHQYNDKYLINLVGGPMEQVYKFPKDAFSSTEQVKKLVDEHFTQKAVKIHQEMMTNYKHAAALIKQG